MTSGWAKTMGGLLTIETHDDPSDGSASVLNVEEDLCGVGQERKEDRGAEGTREQKRWVG